MSDKGTPTEWPWVVVGHKGVYWLGHARDEDHAWTIALGWPPASEIEACRAAGWYAAHATVTWQKPNAEVSGGRSPSA